MLKIGLVNRSHMNQQSIDRLERGIHGYFPLGRPQRIFARSYFDGAGWDAFVTLEEFVDQALLEMNCTMRRSSPRTLSTLALPTRTSARMKQLKKRTRGIV